MTTANGITLTTMQALVPTFLIPFIPDQMMSSSPSYQRQNTRPLTSPFQKIWPSPRVILTIKISSIYWNLTPEKLTIILAYLHLLQSAPLDPTTYMLTSPYPRLSSQSYLPHTPSLFLLDTIPMAYPDATTMLISIISSSFSSSNRTIL